MLLRVIHAAQAMCDGMGTSLYACDYLDQADVGTLFLLHCCAAKAECNVVQW